MDNKHMLENICSEGLKEHSAHGCFHKVGTFVGVYSLSGIVTSILNVYIASQISAIEKQFGLSSSQSGFLLSCNDIGFLFTTLFASYLTRRVHIPRVLLLSAMLYGIAGIICSMPYFVSKGFIEEQTRHLGFGLGKPDMDSDVLDLNISKPSISIAVTRFPVCNKMSEVVGPLYPDLTSNFTDCTRDDVESQYGVGIPNRYTKVAVLLLAAGKYFRILETLLFSFI